MNPTSKSSSLSNSFNSPNVPAELNEKTLLGYIRECQDIVGEYQRIISIQAGTIDRQDEAIKSQIKHAEEFIDFASRFKKRQDPSFADVVIKVSQAVSAIFFFLLHLLRVAGEMIVDPIMRRMAPILPAIAV